MPQATPFLVALAVSAVLTGAGVLIQKTRQRGGDSGDVSSGHLVTRRNHQDRIPRVYGRCRVGVNNVYAHTAGSTNKYLYMVCAICEGPIKGIVRQDGTTYETTGSQLPESNPPLIYLDNVLWIYNPADVYIEFFDGSDSQAVSSTMSAAHGSWADAMRNTAYFIIRLKYDRKRHMSQPNQITVVIDGMECYDPITTTTGWTDNPAICAYNYMTASGFRGGMGIPAAKIDTTSLSDFKDYCDDLSWTANLPLHEAKPDADHLQAILDGGRGRIIESGGVIKFRFFDLNYEAVSMNLTAEDIVVDRDGAELIEFSQPDIADRPNTIRVKFLNGKDYKYIVDDFVLADDDAIDDDGGDRREMEVGLHGLSEMDTAQKMANYHLERARYNRTLTGQFGRRCIALEPMDLVTLTFDPFGWDEKYFRVLQHSIKPDLTVDMSLQEEADALYNDDYDPSNIEYYDTTLPGPGDTVPSVLNVSYSEETYPERQRSRSRIVVDFDPPAETTNPFWSYAEVWVRRGLTGTWEYKTKAGENDGSSNYTLDPVEEGETYYIKFVSVTIHGQKEDFDTAYTLQHLVLGLDSNPASISALTAISNGGNVTLTATWSGDDDVANFEIRAGESFNDGVVVTVAPAHSNDLRATINGFRPGTHTFWAAALNNAGLYSSTPVSAQVTVYIPPGYTELATYGSWTWDFSTGTFSNSAQTTHTFGGTSYDALECSHTGDVLVGTWESPTHDLGAVEKVKIWGDFVVDLDSSDKQWSNNFPAATAWSSLGIDGKSWTQIFSLQESGKVQATLKAKDTDTAWTSATEYDFFEMQAVEIENRYVRVVLTINDPNIGSNLYVKELDLKAYEGPA